MTKRNLIAILAGILVLSCGTDKKEILLDELEGKWQMIEAKRNGDVTNTLEDAFLLFKDNTFSHNLMGDSVSHAYTIDESSIQVGDQLIDNMQIQALNADTLMIKTKIANFRFEFLMEKYKNE